jgi:hypothetical protein
MNIIKTQSFLIMFFFINQVNPVAEFLKLSGNNDENIISIETTSLRLKREKTNHGCQPRLQVGSILDDGSHPNYLYLPSNNQKLYEVYEVFDRKQVELGNYFNQLTLKTEHLFDQPSDDKSRFAINVCNIIISYIESRLIFIDD